MSRIFISYRREDSADFAGRLYDRLSQHFGKNQIFMDIDPIEPGLDFVEVIEKAVGSCDVLIAVIGRQWLTITDATGQRRLDNPADFVRLEIKTALDRNIRVIPALIPGGTMPQSQHLPDGLKKLAYRNAIAITARFHPEVNHLIEVVEKVLGSTPVSAPSKPKPASTQLPQVLPQHPFEPELIRIPAGKFLMGSDPSKDKHAEEDEQPQHSLYLPNYYIAKTPVTNAQYAAFVRAIGLRLPEQWNWKRKEPPQGEENHPVVDVSWQDAVAHCRWLAKTTGKPYRLPTEAEWEKAARGTDGRIYPWGNLWAAKRCNTAEGGKNRTTSVGSYPGGASPYGVLDMAGNVREWVADWYDEKYYSNSPAENPPGPPKGDYKVLRGGSWYFFADYARASNRCGSNPADQSGDIGFRCVVSAP